MDKQKKQAESIGNMSSEIQSAEPGEGPTEALSTSSPESIAIALANTLNEGETPKSPIEGLGLLQSRYFDLRSLGLKVILEGSSKGNLYAVISWPGHILGEEEGHITADGIPVLSKKEPEE